MQWIIARVRPEIGRLACWWRNRANVHEMPLNRMVMYDALYAQCRECQKKTRIWPQKN